MSDVAFLQKGDSRLRNGYRQKIPIVYSKMTWKLMTPGLHPPPGTTYDTWLSCDEYFTNVK